MGFEQIDEACLAGQRAENADFATPTGTAGINPIKIAKRNIYVPFVINESLVVSNVTFTPTNVFPGLTFPNASAAYALLAAMCPRGEISPGESGILKIAWSSAGTAGNVRFVVDLKPVIQGSTDLALALTRNIIQAANGSGNALSIAKIPFPPAIFNSNQIWGIKVARDPANTLDTLASDIIVHSVWMEILGRC